MADRRTTTSPARDLAPGLIVRTLLAADLIEPTRPYLLRWRPSNGPALWAILATATLVTTTTLRFIASGAHGQGQPQTPPSSFAAQDIGINLADSMSYYNSWPWVADAAHALCGQGGDSWDINSGTLCPLDSNRYPTGTGTNPCFAQTNLWYPAGVYTVSWSGPADAVTIDGSGYNGIGGSTGTWSHTAGTNTGTWTRPSADAGGNPIRAKITIDGVSNLVIQAPAGIYTGHFLNDFLEKMRPFSTIRAMDLLRVISGPYNTPNQQHGEGFTKNWSDRVFPAPGFTGGCAPAGATASSERGVLYEDLILLANEANKNLWFNIPIFATDDYICRLARLLAYGETGDKLDTACNPSAAGTPSGTYLNTNSYVYLEYINENWNSQFGHWSELNCAAQGFAQPGRTCFGAILTPNGATFNASTSGFGSAWVNARLANGSDISATINRNVVCTAADGTLDTAECGTNSPVGASICRATNWGGGNRCAGKPINAGDVADQRSAAVALMNKRIGDIFRTVWSTAGRDTAKIRNIFGGRLSVGSQTGAFTDAKQAFVFLDAAYPGLTPAMHNQVYWGMAIAPYFTQKNDPGGGPAGPSGCVLHQTTTTACLNNFFATLSDVTNPDGFKYDDTWSGTGTASTDAALALDAFPGSAFYFPWGWWLNANASIANIYSVALVAYEGGQGLWSDSAGTNNYDAQNDARMYTAYRHMFTNWNTQTEGNTGITGKQHLYNQYFYAGFGDAFWGALNNGNQAGSQKYDAIASLACRPGDVNCDGTVDAADCTVMTGANWCQTSKWRREGDLNHDGKVSEADLALLNATIQGASCSRPSPCSP